MFIKQHKISVAYSEAASVTAYDIYTNRIDERYDIECIYAIIYDDEQINVLDETERENVLSNIVIEYQKELSGNVAILHVYDVKTKGIALDYHARVIKLQNHYIVDVYSTISEQGIYVIDESNGIYTVTDCNIYNDGGYR